MAVDYNRTRATVERIIKAYGRPVTFINDAGPLNPANPLGPAGPAVQVSNVMGVFVRPSGYIKLGESTQMDPGMWPEADKIILVLPRLDYDFTVFTRVIDTDLQGYKVYKTELIKPGMIPLLMYVGLKR